LRKFWHTDKQHRATDVHLFTLPVGDLLTLLPKIAIFEMNNMANMELDIIVRGRVSGGAKGEIVNTLKDCYRHFGSKVPYKVEVLITDSEAIMLDYMRQEKFKMGIIEDKHDDSICLYDIWKGYPRITISIEKLERYSKGARPGLIRHQSAHSVLHGSMAYRIFKIPEDCQQIATIKSIQLGTLEQVLQKLSLAVKDCEASKLLVQHEYINCQLAFALEWIQLQMPNVVGAKTGRIDRQQKFISQIEMLQPILYSMPLIAAPQSRKISLDKQVLLGRRIEELLHIQSPNEQSRILQIANSISDSITEDTHHNMDLALHQVMSLA
jgi:hypothetical protein